jgi:hypothetical protein
MIDVIAEAEGITISGMQFKAMVGKGNIDTKHVPFVWPISCWDAIFICYRPRVQLFPSIGFLTFCVCDTL